MSNPYVGESPDGKTPGVTGKNDAAGDGVLGKSDAGRGVVGVSEGRPGVGVWGSSKAGRGVVGVVERRRDDAVRAEEGGKVGKAVRGGRDSVVTRGIEDAPSLADVVAGDKRVSLIGKLQKPGAVLDIIAEATKGEDVGVWGETAGGRGVVGVTHKGGAGVWGATSSGRGVVGVDDRSGAGVWGEAKSGRGVVGVADGRGTAVHGEKRGDGGFAGYFVGDVHVTGNLSTDGDIVLANADCAEDFDVRVADDVTPGTVMVIGDDDRLLPCSSAYDRRVAGVVSGAGTYRPALVLDRGSDVQGRAPIALMGKVWCKVDAAYGAIERGDLLTSSPTVGHAMKARDPSRAFGAVIGKALADLRDGVGLVPVLVALQ